jgi:hypothetical protein
MAKLKLSAVPKRVALRGNVIYFKYVERRFTRALRKMRSRDCGWRTVGRV